VRAWTRIQCDNYCEGDGRGAVPDSATPVDVVGQGNLLERPRCSAQDVLPRKMVVYYLRLVEIAGGDSQGVSRCTHAL